MDAGERKTIAHRLAKAMAAKGMQKKELYKRAGISFTQMQDILHQDTDAKARHGVKLLRAMGLLPDQVRVDYVPVGVSFWDWLHIMLHAGHFSTHLEAGLDRLEELAATVTEALEPLPEARAKEAVQEVRQAREWAVIDELLVGEYFARLEHAEGIKRADVERFVDLSVAYSPVIITPGSTTPVEVRATIGQKKYILLTAQPQEVDVLALSVMRYRYLQYLAKQAGQSVEQWFEKLKQSTE